MPKIIHIITGLSTGGAEMALYNLLNGGLAERFNSLIISLVDEGVIGEKIKALGVPVAALGMRNGLPSFDGIIKLRKLVREFQPDVIQGWMYHGNLGATLARTLASDRPILSWNVRHSLYKLDHEKLMMRQVIRMNKLFSAAPDALLYNSHVSRKQHESFGFSSLNGRVISNGIDVQRFCFSDEARKCIRTELGIPKDAQVVGHVARLHPMKDHKTFLHAVMVLALRYKETHFILSGRGVSLENKALTQMIPTSLSNRFHLLGERGDVPELMSAIDIFCLSSAWGEGFPNVIGEAMATGLPCVATDVGDSKIIIGDSGVVVPVRDEEKLSLGIDKLLTLSSQERRSLGERARNKIEKNYTLSAIVEQYISLYDELLRLNKA